MIGRRLAAVRAELGLIQATLVDQVGLSKRAYIHYERGEREPPLGLFKAIYDLYGINYLWLMFGPEPEPQQAGAERVDFALIVTVVDELERQLAARGRELKEEHKVWVIWALYQLGREQGRVTEESVASVRRRGGGAWTLRSRRMATSRRRRSCLLRRRRCRPLMPRL